MFVTTEVEDANLRGHCGKYLPVATVLKS